MTNLQLTYSMMKGWKFFLLRPKTKQGCSFSLFSTQCGIKSGNSRTPMVDSCQCMAKPIQYCKVKIKKFKKTIKNKNILFHYGLSQEAGHSSLCYTIGTYLSILNIRVCIYQFQTPSASLPPPLPLGNHRSDLYVCESVSVLQIDSLVHILDSTYKWYHMVFIFLLPYLLQHDNLQSHLCCCKCIIFFFF